MDRMLGELGGRLREYLPMMRYSACWGAQGLTALRTLIEAMAL
jgi:hypothetical protein